MPIRITGLNSGLDTESIISALVSSYSYKTQKYEKAQTKLSWKQDAWKSLNTKIYSLYTSISNLRYSSAYNLKSATVSDSTKITVTAGSSAVNGAYSVQVGSLAKSAYLTGEKIEVTKTENGETKTEKATASTTLGELGYTGDGDIIDLGNGSTLSVTSTTKISDVINWMKEKGLNANFDETNGRIFISSKKTGAESNFTLSAEEMNVTTATKENNALMALGLLTKTGNDQDDYELEQSNYIAGASATIRVNGVDYTSDSNTFSINGMTFTATGLTTELDANGGIIDEPSTAITVTVNTDTQGIYDKIKDFLTQYNTIINEMTSLYNADSASGYEPLTDEEKDAMSETEIEKWEEKIKSSLLRRDNTLSSLISSMTSAMSKGIVVGADENGNGGKTYYLSSFGIKTLGYLNAAENEQNAYHIDGDEDDVNTAGNTDKLLTAIANDPDSVVEFMQNLATNLYNAIDSKMKSTTLSSVYTVYNDKEMASEYSDYTSLITKWQERLEEQEEYYYQKFAAMETALSKLNSQSSSMSGFFS